MAPQSPITLPELTNTTDTSADTTPGHLPGFQAGYNDGWKTGISLHDATDLEICKTRQYRFNDPVHELCGGGEWDIIIKILAYVLCLVGIFLVLMAVLWVYGNLPNVWRSLRGWVRDQRGKARWQKQVGDGEEGKEELEMVAPRATNRDEVDGELITRTSSGGSNGTGWSGISPQSSITSLSQFGEDV
ncbi:MAG: hypothetical protein Q9183_006504 [Haloplaca sp. 2 TL-2023]